MYFIHKIKDFVQRNKNEYGELLPSCVFVLTKKSAKITVTGFLPCHHSNIGYELELSKNNTIVHIISIKIIDGKTPTLPALRSYKHPNYELIANEAIGSVGLLVCSVIYSLWNLKKMDIQTQFEMLCVDIERSAIREFPYACHLYQVDRAIECIENALIIMKKPPYNKIKGFKGRMKWQKETQYNTATKEKPTMGGFFLEKERVKLIEYKGVFCTESSVRVVEHLARVFTTNTTKLVQGSLQDITGDIVVLNVEDAYRVRCQIGKNGNIFMMKRHNFTKSKCRNLGITAIKQLQKKQKHINVAFAHLWGVEEWTQLATFEAESYTIIGRLDQYPRGRGQFFRDMLESNQFPSRNTRHFGTENVICIQSNDILATVGEICSKYDTVQCFNTDKVSLGIDCGRRLLYNPGRIRSLRSPSEALYLRLPQMPLHEEHYNDIKQLRQNASEQYIKHYRGAPINAGIFICSENTNAFDIVVARSHCRQALYLINGRKMFSMNPKPPSRTTVNPFK